MADQAETTPEAPETPAAEAPARPGLADTFAKMRDDLAAPAEETPADEGDEHEEEIDPEGDPKAAPEADSEGGEHEEEEELEEGEEDEEEEEDADEEELEEGEAFVLALPGRNAGDPDEEIELDGLTREQREAFLRLRKGYLRREAFNTERQTLERERTQVQQDKAELDAIEQALRDPQGASTFILERVADAEVRRTLALDILVDLLDAEGDEGQQAYDRFIEELQDLEADPVRRENRRLKRPKVTAPKRPEPEQRVDPDVQQVYDHIRSFIPADMSEKKAQRFVRLALEAVHTHLVDNNLEAITPEQVDEVTAPVRAAYGFGSSARGRKKGTPSGSKKGAPAPAAPRAPSAQGDPRETGKRLAKASARRREAATVPSGGGAPPVAPNAVPKGGGIKDAIAALKQNMGR